MCTHTKNSAEIALEVSPKDAKTYFVFLEPIRCGVSAAYPAPILTAFEIKDVNRCPHAYSGKKISEFLRRKFYNSQKQLQMGTFKGMFVIRLQLKRHNFGQWESFWGLVNIPRMCLL